MLEVIGIPRSSYYDWVAAADGRAERALADDELAAKIVVIQDPKADGDPAYGVPRVTAELNDKNPDGDKVNHKKVQRVMKTKGLKGIQLRKKTKTTVSDQSAKKHEDLLKRDFTAELPNQKYCGDITYIPIKGGKNLYLATVLDCGSRQAPGWAMADHMRKELVMDALKAADRYRAPYGGLRGAIFHSDHGSQYTSNKFTDLCAERGVTQSMGAIGSSADNAWAESWNATIKRELLAGRPYFESEADAYRAVFRWINRYNTKRRNSYCNYATPNKYEIELVNQKQLSLAA